MTTLQQITNEIASSADMIAMYQGKDSKFHIEFLKQKISELEKLITT